MSTLPMTVDLYQFTPCPQFTISMTVVPTTLITTSKMGDDLADREEAHHQAEQWNTNNPTLNISKTSPYHWLLSLLRLDQNSQTIKQFLLLCC